MVDKPAIIRVGTYNLAQGGLANLGRPDDLGRPFVDDSRLRKQLALLARLDLDLLGVQEATWGVHSTGLADFAAEQLGMAWRFVGPSPFYGRDLVAFVRTGDRLTVQDVTHLTGPPFVHGLINVEIRIDGHPRPVHFLVGHSAPNSPGTRILEAEVAAAHRHLDVIYAADFGAAAIGDPRGTATLGVYSYEATMRWDTSPAEELAAARFHDASLACTNRTPTVAHGDDKLGYRGDRIYTTLPPAWITGYGVEHGGDELSSHRPVWAELTLGHQSGDEHDGQA